MHQLEVLRDDRPSRATRRLGRTTSSLEYRDVNELFEVGLHDLLEGVQQQIGGVAEAITDEYFHHHPSGAMQAIATG